MWARRALSIITLFLFCLLVSDASRNIAHADGANDGAIDQANAWNIQTAHASIPAQDKVETKLGLNSALARFEPLLLLLLGSILFSIGTATSLVLSRRLKSKPLQASPGSKETVKNALVY